MTDERASIIYWTNFTLPRLDPLPGDVVLKYTKRNTTGWMT